MPNIGVLRALVIEIIIQVLGKYRIILYKESWMMALSVL